MIGPLGWVLIVALGVFCVALGGLGSSMYNRRYLRKLSADMEQVKRDAAHAKNNARATKQAVEHFAAKSVTDRAEDQAEHRAERLEDRAHRRE